GQVESLSKIHILNNQGRRIPIAKVVDFKEIPGAFVITSGKKKVIVQCFDSVALKEFKRRYNPKFPLIQLIGDNSWKESPDDFKKMLTIKGLKEVKKYADGIGPWFPQLIKPVGRSYKMTPLAKIAKGLGLKIHTYTLRDDSLPPYVDTVKGLANILSREGVDGVFTDFPDRIR
ncbi:MAG: hypothetical protein KC478_16960, partial [Bacteriovoracaceae bacterium]|nr:hypothetical protein [Bacteriovoracaceae bacterium]